MADFTTRPVSAGLPTLAEIEEATQPTQSAYERSRSELKLRRFEVVALVTIADFLDQLVEQGRELLEHLRSLES